MWYLKHNGQKKTFEQWGCADDAVVLFVSGAADELTFTAHQAFDANPLFPYNAEVVLYKDNAVWFSGQCVTNPRTGTADIEQQSYKIKGPWHLLQKLTFRQLWRQQSGEAAATQVILGKDIDDNRLTSGEVIKEVLDYAIGRGRSIAYVQTDLDQLDIVAPEDEMTDIMCSEAVHKMLAWHKDVTTSIDYSTSPPTLRFTKRANAGAVTVDVDAGAPNESIHITRRDDLGIGGVWLRYLRTNTIDGREYLDIDEDIAGDVNADLVIENTIQLMGFSHTRQYQEVVVLELPWTDTEIEKRIKEEVPWLTADNIRSIEWSDHNNDSELGGELVGGAIPGWVTEDVDSATISVVVKATLTDGTEVEKTESVGVQVTSAASRTYSKTASFEAGDPLPEGLAAKILAQFADPHFEGAFNALETECSGIARPGQVINMTNGQSAWAAMRGQIQQVRETLSTGATAVTFGPPEHLTPQDFIELARANRRRFPSGSSALRASGVLSDAGRAVVTGGKTRDTKLTQGKSKYNSLGVQAVVDVEGEGKKRTIKLNPADAGWKKHKILTVSEDETEMGLGYLRLVGATEA